MYLQCPVIGINSGGPKETIIHTKTGYLSASNSTTYALYMLDMMDKTTNNDMKIHARKHVEVIYKCISLYDIYTIYIDCIYYILYTMLYSLYII